MSLRRGWNVLKKSIPFIGVAAIVAVDGIFIYHCGGIAVLITVVLILLVAMGIWGDSDY